MVKHQRKDSNKPNLHGSCKKASIWLLIQNDSEKHRKKIYKLVTELKKIPNKFQSHSVFSLDEKTGSYKPTNVCPLEEILKKQKESKEEKNQTVPEIWQVVFRGLRKLALITHPGEMRHTWLLDQGHLLLIS